MVNCLVEQGPFRDLRHPLPAGRETDTSASFLGCPYKSLGKTELKHPSALLRAASNFMVGVCARFYCIGGAPEAGISEPGQHQGILIFML